MPIYAILLLLMALACKERDTANLKADYSEQPPGSDETWTAARTIALNSYAADLLSSSGKEKNTLNEQQLLLDKSLKIAGVSDYDPLSFYTLSIGPFGQCFGEAKGDYDIWSNAHRDALKKQIEEAAYFIRSAHYAMLGKNSGPFVFKEIIICPEEKVGSKMLLVGYQLYIGIPYSLGYYRPIPAMGGKQNLQSLWNSGAPLGLGNQKESFIASIRRAFSSEAKAEAAARTIWKLFNPLAPLRQSIRKVLHENGNALAGRLQAAPVSGRAKEMLRRDFVPFGDKTKSAIDASMLTTEMQTRFDRLSETQTTLLTRNWACLGHNAQLRGELEVDALTVINQQIHNETNSITKEVRAGLVAVTNHHRVGINVGVGGSSGRYLQMIPVVSTRDTKINTKTTAGLVAVDTSDDISVDLSVALNLAKSMQTASFVAALDAAEDGRDLCTDK